MTRELALNYLEQFIAGNVSYADSNFQSGITLSLMVAALTDMMI